MKKQMKERRNEGMTTWMDLVLHNVWDWYIWIPFDLRAPVR
jgi:hypothetical protein